MMELIHFLRWHVFLCLALVTVVAHLSSCIYSEQTEAAGNINHLVLGALQINSFQGKQIIVTF